MDKTDAKQIIEDLTHKPFISSDTTIMTDSGYVIMTEAEYNKLLDAAASVFTSVSLN